MPNVRTAGTSPGARVVQIVYSYHRGPQQMEYIGFGHDDAELELLKAVARQQLAAGQGVLDLGPWLRRRVALVEPQISRGAVNEPASGLHRTADLVGPLSPSPTGANLKPRQMTGKGAV